MVIHIILINRHYQWWWHWGCNPWHQQWGHYLWQILKSATWGACIKGANHQSFYLWWWHWWRYPWQLRQGCYPGWWLQVCCLWWVSKALPVATGTPSWQHQRCYWWWASSAIPNAMATRAPPNATVTKVLPVVMA